MRRLQALEHIVARDAVRTDGVIGDGADSPTSFRCGSYVLVGTSELFTAGDTDANSGPYFVVLCQQRSTDSALNIIALMINIRFDVYDSDCSSWNIAVRRDWRWLEWPQA